MTDNNKIQANLTEQWKKGELQEGFYYVKCDWSDEVEIRYVHNGVDDWKAIVAEVPTYEEYQKLLSDQLAKIEGEEINAELENSIKDLKHRNENLRLALKTYELPEIQKILTDWRTGKLDKKFNKLEKENEKLKELLKECRECVDENLEFSKSIGRNRIQPRNKGLLKRIDEALK